MVGGAGVPGVAGGAGVVVAGGAEVVVELVVVPTRQKPPPDESMFALYKSAKSAFEQQLHLSTVG